MKTYESKLTTVLTNICTYLLSMSPRFASGGVVAQVRSEEHTSELQSHSDLVCRLLLEKKKNNKQQTKNNKKKKKKSNELLRTQ